LANAELLEAIAEAARMGGAQARVVSGAIGAIDALAAAALDGLKRVTHTTRKPAIALLPGAEAARLVHAQLIFSGNAREAALRFPESMNVAAAVSLAGIGFDRTEVRILADPDCLVNRHEVVAEGAFGTFRFEIQNVPSETNPKTSRIVAASVVKSLLQRQSCLTVG
jgi:aspartate dehydrogenase